MKICSFLFASLLITSIVGSESNEEGKQLKTNKLKWNGKEGNGIEMTDFIAHLATGGTIDSSSSSFLLFDKQNKPNIGSNLKEEEQNDASLAEEFHITLWSGLVFVIVLLSSVLAIYNMDIGKDSIIYRLTSLPGSRNSVRSYSVQN
eukprot:TRINITY_DN2495_c0_g1_i2.p1 TRINITY_DN2495_c0_g1~~TRINITY_DN2495_c0_g1_i2.p1  ORF type:complete len:147 (+),score=73.05 TRINITY_DN2495_c0_g1_i2:155-595(+)